MRLHEVIKILLQDSKSFVLFYLGLYVEYQPDVPKSAVFILPGPSIIMSNVVQIELVYPHGLKCNCAALKTLAVSLKLHTANERSCWVFLPQELLIDITS